MRKALRKYLFVAAICLCTALTMAPVHAKAAGKVKNPAIVRLKPGKKRKIRSRLHSENVMKVTLSSGSQYLSTERKL